ncbi:hypothetical protein ANN_18672 [Periplaneta americana]|uniref:Mos1 transposase HTH domain-containing protein n=1 Tax=Periplaneta americana TaxID=6978 RepID=A0ABQ8SPD8_PERAM|nr:hypothetical protein ANN_18672 [Periplaneta americana]
MIKQEYGKSEPSALLKAMDEFRSGAVGLNECCRKTAAETVNDDALGKSHVYEWFSRFKSANMSTEDMPRPGRPSTGRNDENIAKIKRATDEDH